MSSKESETALDKAVLDLYELDQVRSKDAMFRTLKDAQDAAIYWINSQSKYELIEIEVVKYR